MVKRVSKRKHSEVDNGTPESVVVLPSRNSDEPIEKKVSFSP